MFAHFRGRDRVSNPKGFLARRAENATPYICNAPPGSEGETERSRGRRGPWKREQCQSIEGVHAHFRQPETPTNHRMLCSISGGGDTSPLVASHLSAAFISSPSPSLKLPLLPRLHLSSLPSTRNPPISLSLSCWYSSSLSDISALARFVRGAFCYMEITDVDVE